jgi:SNF2 family DNA or RNA helicase
MNLTIEQDKFMLQFAFEAQVINRVKSAGFKWSPKAKKWVAPADVVTAMSLSAEFPELKTPLDNFLPIEVNNWSPSPYLMDHQEEAGKIGLKNPRFGFFDDTGTGKTLTGIELVKQKKVKSLVVCKLSLIVNAWLNDLGKFAPELRAVNLWKLKGKKIPEHDIGIINYEQFRTTHKKLTGYRMVLLDESSVAKDSRSQTTKALIEYCDQVPYVYLFSGTPAPNSELEYWSQMRIIDPLLLGRSYYQFRNKFCFSSGYGGYEWKMRDDLREEFLNKIGTKSRVIRKEDVLDLPERTFNVRSVTLTRQEMDAYRTMERELLIEIEGRESVAANSAVKIMKLRQGTSGFFYDSEGKAMVYGFSKLDALMELLEEIGNHQVIIWTHFHEEADQIERLLGNNCCRVDGTITSQTAKDNMVQAFMGRQVQYLISHPASLGHGVTLTNCTYAVYFSLSHSYELAYQSQDRIYRKGQRNACSYYYLVAEKTVDEAILRAIEKKGNTAQAVFDYLRRNK